MPLPLPRVPSYSHINVQPAPEADQNTSSTETEDFIQRDSLQDEIKDNLLYSSQSSSEALHTARPLTFAEATMSNRRGRRYEDISDPALGKATSGESLGPAKHTLRKKKKVPKWTPFDFGAVDSASEGASVGETPSTSRIPSPIPVTTTPTSTTTPNVTLTTSTTPILTTSTTPNVTTDTTIPQGSNSTSPFTSTPIPLPAPASSSTSPILQQANSVATASIYKEEQTRIGDGYIPTVADTPCIPDETTEARAQAPLRFAQRELPGSEREVLDQHHTQFDFPYSFSDTQNTENQADEEMSSTLSSNPGKDKEGSSNNYDSVELDPRLAAQIQSPKATPLAQPVTYTTVGSVIDPNAAPQFTAPNRIQREGSGRRPMLPMMQGRQHDSFYTYRGQSPFNASSGLHHAHQHDYQHDQSPNNFGFSHTLPPNATRSTRSGRSLQQMISLTEQEKSVLENLHDTAAPQMFSGNQRSSSSTPMPFSKPSSVQSGISQRSFHLEESAIERDMGRPTSFQGPIQRPAQGPARGSDFHAVQSLSKFYNPMQEEAQGRIDESSFSKAPGTAVTLDNPSMAVEELLRRKDQSSAVTSTRAEASTQKVGELDRAYRFPLPGTADPSKPQANPLFGAFSPSTTGPSNDPPLRQPGYPAPLTAGPPGHRQYQGTINRAPVNYPDHGRTDQRPSAFNSYGGASTQASSRWPDLYNVETTPQYTYESVVPSHSGGVCHGPIQDTISMENVSKYYPRGLPSDMTGHVVPLTYATRVQMSVADQIPRMPSPETAAEKAARKKAALDEWFYGGQRRFAGMTGADHIREYEERQLESLNPYGPIGPRPKQAPRPIQKKPFTIEESNKMTVTEAAAPLLDGAFGSLLSYLTPANAPDSAKVLSRFEPSESWMLDTSENGNKSFYGEDWGMRPKKTDKDPKKQ